MKLPHEPPGCVWLFASSGSRTMMEYYCSGGVLQYASGHLTPNELLHVHCVREGERVAKASPSPASHHAHGRGRDVASLTNCSCLCVYDRWAQQVVGPPVMQPKAGAVKAPELSPRGRGRCSNQISRSCTSWRDTSKHCTRYKSFYTFQMDYFVCRHILLHM